MSTKVFVGNLSFKTQTEALREHFSAAGTVESANIITRGPRSLGYGFVDFKTAADAENAVKLFNQKEIDGRVVNVEVAHPRQEEAAGAAGNGEKAERPPRARRPRRRSTAPAAGAEGEAAPAAQPTGGRRYRPRPQAADDAAPAAQAEGAEGAPADRPKRGRFGPRRGPRRGPKAAATNADGTPAATGSPKPAAPRQPRERKPREPKAPRPQRPKEQSSTTLFVANLPFAVTDAELAEIFSGLKVTKAHVVTKRNGKSKGFGFVEFANQEDQLAALAAKDGQVYQERPLNVKVALVQAVADAEAEKAAAEGAEAKEEAAPAPAPAETPKEEPKAEAGSA